MDILLSLGQRFCTLSRIFLLLFLLTYSALLCATPEYTPGQLLFKTSSPNYPSEGKTGLSAFDGYLSQYGIKSIKPMKGMPGERYFKVDLSQMPDLQEMKSLNFAGIEYIEPNYLRKLHTIPNDPLYPQQLLYLSSIPQAWDYTTGNNQIIVAVIDSGLLLDHPDIAANVYHNIRETPDSGIDNDGNGFIDDWCGWDFADAPEMASVALGDYMDQDNDPTDESFHGTHVSGIVGAEGNNSFGISGVAWDVRIMPLRAGFRTIDAGYLQDDDVAAAIIYAADNGAHVVNMSWGDTNYSAIIADACDYAYAKGVVLVASSGNDGSNGVSYPAKLSNVISVGSVNHAKVVSNFSSYGPELDLVAPGEGILSTYKNTGNELFTLMSGTSMSAPMVSGSIALLLSLVPGLSPAEVRARLLTSTDDINTPGYDIRSGHGLLNTRKLLENLNPPFIEIDYPLDQSAISATTEFRGSVYGSDFARYTLMYTPLPAQETVVWMDIQEHTMQPTYHTTEVVDDVLGVFRVPSGFPDGKYLVRLQFEKRQNNLMKYNYYRTITVERDAAQLVPSSLQSFQRYSRAELRHYIRAAFDRPVRSELRITDSVGENHIIYSSVSDTVQVWALPPNLPPGNIDISIMASGHNALTYESPVFEDFLNISYHTIPNYGFIPQPIGNARVPLNRWYDFNGSGKQEYLAMDIPVTGYGEVRSYEVHGKQHIQTHLFPANFWPLDIGNTNARGIEILALQSEIGKLWETRIGENYPDPDSLIFNDTSIMGGIMADLDGNGNPELILVKNLPTERVVQIYGRNAQGIMSQRATLHNITETYLRNNFVPSIIAYDFSGNGQKEILTADTDGDIMIFHTHGNTSERIWHYRLPVANAYQMAKGDFDGDGKMDFIVGGYNTDIVDPNLNFWHFEAFSWDENTNSFQSMGSIEFNQVESQNAILAMNIDGDSLDEIVLGISPNLYIVKYLNSTLTPIFVGDSYANYQLAGWEEDAGTSWVMSNYRVSADSLIAVQWVKDEIYTGPEIPINFLATPLDESSVQLSWLGNSGGYYRIYRKDETGAVSIIEPVYGNSYTDFGLTALHEYQYALANVDDAFDPPESQLTDWQYVIPMPIPDVLEISMVGDREVRAIFNQPLDASALNPMLYTLSHNLGYPLSVNSTHQQQGVQLRFRDAFPVSSSPFTLTIQGLRGTSGVAMGMQQYQFPYVSDLDPPKISFVNLTEDNNNVLISFNETIDPQSAVYLGNYSLYAPDNDPDNAIADISINDNIVNISFAHSLKHSNEAYFIRVENITDLFGNLISPLHNLARFAVRDFDDLKDIVVFPNPLKRNQDNEIIFMNFPSNKKGEIAIYDVSGSLVIRKGIGPFNPESNHITWRWNVTNSDGKRLSSGIYFYVIEMDGERARGKFAIIN
nr:hypothetical protein [Candidatus Cloacimonadota bacterium]